MDATTTKPHSISVIGFQYAEGKDKFFSARVYVDGEFAAALPLQSGSGDDYLRVAGKWLEDNGHLTGTERGLRHVCTERKIELSHELQTLRSKKPVVSWGVYN